MRHPPENRLQYVDSVNTYLYNASGQRVAKGTPSGNTFYIYGSDGQVVSERDSYNNWIQTYLHFGGRLVAIYRGQGANANTGFFFQDHLGSTRLITLMGWSVYDNMDYLPFGEQELLSGTDGDPHKFTGKERDTESGLDNFGARYYSSNFGRFMSPDPDNAGTSLDNPQSWNAYSYVLNNPLNSIDPDGLDCVYLNDAGTAVDGPNGVDRNSNSGECTQHGGTWFYGTINSNFVRTDPNSDWVSAEGVTAGGLGSNQQFSCGGSSCSQDALKSFVNSITGGPSSVTVSDTSGALSPDAAAILGQVYQDARIVESGPLWAGCTAIGGLLGQPPEFQQPATHVGVEALAKGLEDPKTATLAARAYHTATDARFTAGGKFSKVLVPRTAKALHPALGAAGKAVSVAGWGLLAYDTYQAGMKCAPIMKH